MEIGKTLPECRMIDRLIEIPDGQPTEERRSSKADNQAMAR